MTVAIAPIAFELAPDVFTNKKSYLNTVNSGIPGSVVRNTVNMMPSLRSVIVSALGTTSTNLSRLYARKSLNKQQTEEMLDILRIHSEAVAVFGDANIANEWLNTRIPALDGEMPIDLFDTFVGRSMVSDAICVIRCGEFS